MADESKYHQALTMFRMGKSYSEICNAVGLRRDTLRSYISRGRARGELPPGEKDKKPEDSLVLSQTLLDGMRPQAIARDLTPKQLARQILECVCKDNLIDAVLDDRAEKHV